GLSISDWISVETLSGFATRPFINNAEDIQFTDLTRIEPINLYVGGQWRNNYFPINNCNSVIQNLTGSTLIDEATRNKFLGEAYFLRAYYYFQLVRLFGDVPLRIVPVTTLEEANAPRNKQEAVFEQIVSDLKQAETSGLPGLSSDGTGRVTMTAIKSLLAKVYLNMAGYPLNRGNAYYQLAYDKAVEVINSGQASLIPDFKSILIAANENKTENIFMVQREATYAQSIMHYSMLPYPVPNPQLSANNNIGGAMEVVRPFFDSYAAGDIRKNQNYLWDYDYPNNDDRFIMVYKYWDQTAVVSGLSGQNIPLIRYADVLLIAAEAKANVDGGATSDGAALQAYYLVHHRGVPTAAQPASITVDDVLRERFWEFCFENQTWFDMVRTQKTMDVASPA
ncbi:MAG: RagB/SusD family nutrient uptake outer membrane protein, partial [Sphingobacteriales bacterium]